MNFQGEKIKFFLVICLTSLEARPILYEKSELFLA